MSRRARLRQVVALGLVLAIGAGWVGQLVRDRSVVLALMLYLPMIPMGVVALGLDAICRGRALAGPRFWVGTLGLVSVIGASLLMIGSGPGSVVATGPEVSLLHWNVVWGGGKKRNPGQWAKIRLEILSRGADLVVLSEAPPDDWLEELVASMGPGATRVQIEHQPGAANWFKLVVASKAPLRLVRREPIDHGAGMVVEAEIANQTLRLLVIDAQSSPFVSRTPRLLDVADACRRARDAAEPIDLVVGDFNSVSRSLGFDAIEAQGYALASRVSRGWRGTFPSGLPIYDIDHVWVGRDRAGLRSEFFTNLASDHRGQVARFRLGW